MCTIESDMLGYEERGTVGGQSTSGSSSSSPSSARRPWTPPDPETARKLSELIKDIGTAMLTTVAPDGGLRSRPMVAHGRGLENGELWFFTADDSGKVSEIESEHEVNLAYSEPKDQRYVSLSGRARLVRDVERARRLWTPELKAWFPAGPDDKHLALLRVRIHSAEYWDAPSGKMASLLAFAKSKLTGENRAEVVEHEKLLVAR
jgi:general stress protein 26